MRIFDTIDKTRKGPNSGYGKYILCCRKSQWCPFQNKKCFLQVTIFWQVRMGFLHKQLAHLSPTRHAVQQTTYVIHNMKLGLHVDSRIMCCLDERSVAPTVLVHPVYWTEQCSAGVFRPDPPAVSVLRFTPSLLSRCAAAA